MSEWRWLIMALFTSVLITAGAVFLLGKTQNPSVVVYNLNDASRPQLSLNKTENDLGRLQVSQTKEADFILKNSGQKTLQLFDLSSSCNCTSVKVIKTDWQSPEFGMHNRGQDIIEVQPQEQVLIKVIYRPSLMPVRGKVARQVFFATNDPGTPRQTLTIKADVYE